MNKVSIPVNRAYDAIMWATEQFGSTYQVQHMFPDSQYQFSFNSRRDAEFFILKWM